MLENRRILDIINDPDVAQNLHGRGLRNGWLIEVIPNPNAASPQYSVDTEREFMSRLSTSTGVTFFNAVKLRYLRYNSEILTRKFKKKIRI